LSVASSLLGILYKEKMKYWTDLSSSNALDLYEGGAWFESWLGHLLSWLRFFMVFLSPSRWMLGIIPRLGYDNFLPNPFQFISHLTIWCHSLDI
jgi:hypothetical protein